MHFVVVQCSDTKQKSQLGALVECIQDIMQIIDDALIEVCASLPSFTLLDPLYIHLRPKRRCRK